MPLIIILFMVIIGITCLIGVSCGCSKSSCSSKQPPVTRQRIQGMTQDQIRERLKILETHTAPEPKMGAMCYEVAAPPERAEYVCPKCGEKTLYSNNNTEFVAWQLDACRREIDILKGVSDLTLALDESSFCAHCSPTAGSHQLALVVTYADGSSRTNAPVSHQDLIILRDFLRGQLSYKTSNDGTQPLKNVSPRLQELLGLVPEKNAGEK